jgi:hypothetical protein
MSSPLNDPKDLCGADKNKQQIQHSFAYVEENILGISAGHVAIKILAGVTDG